MLNLAISFDFCPKRICCVPIHHDMVAWCSS